MNMTGRRRKVDFANKYGGFVRPRPAARRSNGLFRKIFAPPPPTPCRPRSRPCEAERAVLRRGERVSERGFLAVENIENVEN